MQIADEAWQIVNIILCEYKNMYTLDVQTVMAYYTAKVSQRR